MNVPGAIFAGPAMAYLQVVSVLDVQLDDDVGVEDHEIGGHFGGDFDVTLSQLRVHGMQDVVRVAIIARILLLTRDDDGRARRLAMLSHAPNGGEKEVGEKRWEKERGSWGFTRRKKERGVRG